MSFAMLGSRGVFGGFRSTPDSDIIFTRDAGVWSRRTGPSVNGTTFIECHTGEADVPRMIYVDGAWLLAIGPARTNLLPYANFTDGDANDIPDNWAQGNGTNGVDFSCSQNGGPHNGSYWIREDTAQVGGVEDDCAIANTTQYTFSAWVRATGALAPATTLTVFAAGGGVYPSITLPNGAAFDWTLMSVTATTTAASAASNGFFQVSASPGAAVWVALPTFEAGAYPSLCPIPSAGGLTSKPLEKLTLPSAAIGANSGRVRIGVFVPAYANNDFATVHRIVSLSATDYLCYDGSDDTFRVYNNGVQRATSAAQTFSRRTAHMLDFSYGPSGTRLTVDGVTTTNATAWTQIATVAGALGGTPSTGALTEEAGYGDVEFWGSWP